MVSAILQGVAQSLGLKTGFIDDLRRQATPHVVDCVGLTPERMDPQEFKYELWRRRDWCDRRCPQDYEIEPLREGERLVGRRFRFARLNDAMTFKFRFDVVL